MLEEEIKVSLISHLRDKNKGFSESVIASEFVFDNFSRRADLLLVSKSRFFVYEIKSEFDSLARLQGQVEKYLEYFDKVTIVAASKHVESVLAKTPPCVEVIELKSSSKFKLIRKGKIAKKIEPKNLLSLLKQKELKLLSRKLGVPLGKNVDSLTSSLYHFKATEIKSFVVDSVVNRFKYSSEAFKMICADRDISLDDLKMLSNSHVASSIKGNLKNKNLFNEDPKMEDMQKKSAHPIFGEPPTFIIETLKNKE